MPLFIRYCLWPLLLTGQLLAVSLLAWHLLAQVNFGYPLAYKLLSIESHIQVYGPQNRHKAHFAQTSPAEHRALFGEITRAVQNGGKGLADIHYRLPDGRTAPLMREPEVIHLRDVANLITVFYQAGLIGAGVWVLMLGFARWQRLPMPSPARIAAGFLLALVIAGVAVAALGPTRVFYWLHELIFPDEHEWFFFYQDSLMTTLMKAPDLFGVIALWLVGLLLLLWGASLWLTRYWLDHPRTPAPDPRAGGAKAGNKKGGSKRSAKGGNRRA